MASGAFALYVDPPAGAGMSKIGQRVIPFPRTHNAGQIHFTDGTLSLIYDDFGLGIPTIRVDVRILSDNHPPVTTTQNISVGRTVIHTIQQHDVSASIKTDMNLPVGGALTALVEYSTP
jgi:hypothetical protein